MPKKMSHFLYTKNNDGQIQFFNLFFLNNRQILNFQNPVTVYKTIPINPNIFTHFLIIFPLIFQFRYIFHSFFHFIKITIYINPPAIYFPLYFSILILQYQFLINLYKTNSFLNFFKDF